MRPTTLLPGLHRISSLSVPRLIQLFPCCPSLDGFCGGLVDAVAITRSRLSLELCALAKVCCHQGQSWPGRDEPGLFQMLQGLRVIQKYNVSDNFRLGFIAQISFRMELRSEAEVKPRLGTRLQQHLNFVTCFCKVTSINPTASTQSVGLPKGGMTEM